MGFPSLGEGFRSLTGGDWPLLALVMAIPLVPTAVEGLSYRMIVIQAGAALALLLLPLQRKRFNPNLRSPATVLDPYILIWLLVGLVGVFTALMPGLALHKFGYLLSLAVLFYCLTTRITSHAKALVYVAAAGVGALALALLELTTDQAAAILSGVEGSPMPTRSRVFLHSYLGAQYLLPILVILLSLVINRSPARIKAAALLCAGPGLIYLFIIGSRGAYLGALAALVFLFLLRRLRNREQPGWTGLIRNLGPALLVMILLAGGIFGLAYLDMLGYAGRQVVDRIDHFLSPEQVNFNFSRFRIWSDAMDLSRDHLVLGTGLGNFALAFPQYHRTMNLVYHAHNQFIQILCENGVPGLLCLAAMMIHLLRIMVREPARIRKNDLAFALNAGSAGALLVGGLYFFFETPLEWPASAAMLLLSASILLMPMEKAKAGIPAPRLRLPWYLVAGGAILLWIVPAQQLALSIRADLRGYEVVQLVQSGRNEEALTVFEEIEKIWTGRTVIQQLHMESLLRANRFDEALEKGQRSLAIQPDVPRILANCGLCLFMLGRHEEAVAYLKAFILRIPEEQRFSAAFLLGQSYRRAGHPKAAMVIFEDLRRMSGPRIDARELHLEYARTLVDLQADVLLLLEVLDKTLREEGEDRRHVEEIRTILIQAGKRLVIPEKDLPPFEAMLLKVNQTLDED